jgi:hypothetical protein
LRYSACALSSAASSANFLVPYTVFTNARNITEQHIGPIYYTHFIALFHSTFGFSCFVSMLSSIHSFIWTRSGKHSYFVLSHYIVAISESLVSDRTSLCKSFCGREHLPFLPCTLSQKFVISLKKQEQWRTSVLIISINWVAFIHIWCNQCGDHWPWHLSSGILFSCSEKYGRYLVSQSHGR